ncbi:MAG: hypothetical protein K9G46_06365 [Flavobacteriales bacterium]|nr:hypothetical protein [Flavobacteriales bacterium]
MKRILGLDLGTTSIGWAIIEVAEGGHTNAAETIRSIINANRFGIHRDENGQFAVGVRIISQDTSRFDKGLTLNDAKGAASTPTAERRKHRGVHRLRSRYKLRRQKLTNLISELGMLPDGSYYTNTKGKRGEGEHMGKALYQLRDKALHEPISLSELGRILLHLNQCRGYSSDRFAKDEKPKFDYYTGTVTRISSNPIKIDYEKNDTEKVNWLHYSIDIELTENIILENGDAISTIYDGRIFVKEEAKMTIKVGQIITFKYKLKEEKEKGKKIGEYYQVSPTTPNPEDWNYRYQNLNMELEEWCNENNTVGSFFYQKHFIDKSISRIKNNVVNRKWYEHEFNLIWKKQYAFHKEHFENLSIEKLVRSAFKDYEVIFNSVSKKDTTREQLQCLIADKIIFFQRPWQQSKNKARCTFEKIKVKKKSKLKGTGLEQIKEEYVGRSVIPRSHPLHQEFKIWQQINNVKLFYNSEQGKADVLTSEELCLIHLKKTPATVKQELYMAMQNCKSMAWRVFVKEKLGIKNVYDEIENVPRKKGSAYGVDSETGEIGASYYSVNFRKQKKDGDFKDIDLKGNSTKSALRNILTETKEAWFSEAYSGNTTDNPIVSNLQMLWENIYDITSPNLEATATTIEKHFSFDRETCLRLAALKFDDAGMARLSAKAIRQLLPLMSDGTGLTSRANERIQSLLDVNETEVGLPKDERLESLKLLIPDKNTRKRLSSFKSQEDFHYLNYWEAAAVIYGSHSSSKHKASESQRMARVASGSLNNPVVEKIVNESISIINELKDRYGFDEVRLELSRELKASREERQQMWEGMTDSATQREWAKTLLRELKSEYANVSNDPYTRSNVDKIRIIEDVVQQLEPNEYKNKVKEYKLGEPSKAEVNKYLLWLQQNFKCPYTMQPIPFTDVFAPGNAVEIEHIIPRERYFNNSYGNKVITWREVNQAKANHGNRTAYEFLVSKRVEEFVMVGNKKMPLVSANGWEEHVKKMFPKGAKRANLLRKEIPDNPVSRTLKETQYISKLMKEKLSEIVGPEKVWVSSGSVTDLLRERWHLNKVMKDLTRDRFEDFKVSPVVLKLKTIEEQNQCLTQLNAKLSDENDHAPFEWKSGGKIVFSSTERSEMSAIADQLLETVESIETVGKTPKSFEFKSRERVNLVHTKKHYNSKTGRDEEVEEFEGFSKRIDHRHHALDAVIVACTKQNHIQYINTLNAINTADQDNDSEKRRKYNAIKSDVCEGNSSSKFVTPWNKDHFVKDVKDALSELVVSHKNTRLLISPSRHRNGKNISGQVASLRGNLHEETNYASKKHFTGDRLSIMETVRKTILEKQKNQSQTQEFPKTYATIVREVVLKEKYQDILIELLQPYENGEILGKEQVKTICSEVLNQINSKNLIADKNGKSPDKLSVYSEKDKASRPAGLSMDFNDAKEISKITDLRTKRIAERRLRFVVDRKKEIDTLDADKPEKDRLKREVDATPLYSNALYEIRIKNQKGEIKWVELKDFSLEMLNQVEYLKDKTTAAVKELLQSGNLDELKKNYFERPLFTSSIPIPIKKTRQLSYFQDLYEITPKRHVQVTDTFMTYIFSVTDRKTNSTKRVWNFLKFIDAVRLIDQSKPEKINYSTLYDKNMLNYELKETEESRLLFTLAKNDMVYLPTEQLSIEEIEAIDWTDFQSVLPFLFIVKDMNPSRNSIVFQKITIATSITLAEDVANNFVRKGSAKTDEEIKYGKPEMLDRCIKVFSDGLGKKLVPYWEFPNGSWDQPKAQELGLVRPN